MDIASNLTTGDLRRLRSGVSSMTRAVDDEERIDRLRLFEELKSAICAEQASLAVAFDASQRAVQAAAGIPAERRGRGVGAQLGLALRRSPFAATRWLGFATILTRELPATYAELRAGRTTEWRSTLLARETALVSREHRALIDRQLAPKLEQWGDRRTEVEGRRLAQKLDPAAAVARARKAETDRRVTVRPAPDTMAYLTLLLPCAQAVAAYATLARHADGCTAIGDQRGRGQIMADTAVQRLTGHTTATDVAVEVELIVTDTTLTGQSDEPADLIGYGPVPADIARDLISRSDHSRLRRLFTDHTGRLITMETRARHFTPAQQTFLRLRDRTCRTPYCDAAIRHTDHTTPWASGGPTSITNGNGRCATCNLAKQATGWTETAHPDGSVDTRTPTGHKYRSRTPDPPRTTPDYSWPEHRLRQILLDAA